MDSSKLRTTLAVYAVIVSTASLVWQIVVQMGKKPKLQIGGIGSSFSALNPGDDKYTKDEHLVRFSLPVSNVGNAPVAVYNVQAELGVSKINNSQVESSCGDASTGVVKPLYAEPDKIQTFSLKEGEVKDIDFTAHFQLTAASGWKDYCLVTAYFHTSAGNFQETVQIPVFKMTPLR